MTIARTNSPFIIAGAGLGGLTAALAMQRRGMKVCVLEQAAELKEVGAGIQLSANANRVLYRLGLESALTQVARPTAGKRIRLWSTGQTWKLFDLGAESVARYGYPYLTIYRADLHRILADAVLANDPDAIRLGQRVVGFDDNGTSVTVNLASGEHVVGAALIGADGVHSRIRSSLVGADSPVFSGTVAWRGVISADKLPAHLREPYACNWVGPGAHVIHYPLRQGALVNFVGILERNDWQVESWTQRGSAQECAQDFDGWHEDVQTLIHALDEPYKWALMLREPLQTWSKGRVTLLGDACHPTLPMLASGAAMAIEDGFVLARACEAQPDNIESAFTRYERARVDRTARVVRGSAENARRFHNPALANADGAARYVDEEWNEARVLERYEWLFRYNAETAEI